MQNSAFDLYEGAKTRDIRYHIYDPLWTRYDLSLIDMNFTNWVTIKYLNDTGDNFHQDINQLPNNRGGLYMFSIHCPIIPGRTEFPVYIGRAQLTNNQNLRKRCKEYFTTYAKEDERPKITKMIRYWGKELYLSFMELDENDKIVDFEKKLINTLLFPFNDQIPDAKIRQAVKAF